MDSIFQLDSGIIHFIAPIILIPFIITGIVPIIVGTDLIIAGIILSVITHIMLIIILTMVIIHIMVVIGAIPTTSKIDIMEGVRAAVLV
jgi:uncharacterized membrane protein